MAGWFWVYNATLTQFIGASNDIEHNHSGFPVSLCMHAHKVGQVVPRFTAVWHVRNNPPQVHRAIAVTAEELNDTWLPQWTSNGIFPRLIAGYETDTTGLDSAAGATRFTVLASMGAETDLELGILDSSFFARYWSGVQVQGKAPVPEKKYLDVGSAHPCLDNLAEAAGCAGPRRISLLEPVRRA
jgi:hypothetical protein